MATPCIEDIIKAAEGKISAKEAGRILRELSHRAKALADKENIPLPDAASRVAEEVAIQEELKVYVHKRAKLFSLRAFRRGIEAGKSKRGKDFADSFIEYLSEIRNAGKSKSNSWKARFASVLEQNNVLRELRKADDKLALDVFRERWALTSNTPFVTNNKTAQVIAKAIRDIEKEYLALARKHGAWPQDAAGYTGPQTHSPDALRQAGFASGKRFGKENQDLSYKVWREFVTNDKDIRIDWDRTLPGADEAEREAFLKSFHQSVYSGIHGETTEIVDPSKRLGMGSLSERISSQRLFWFADAESQFKYNQKWGNAQFGQSILNEIGSFGRNIAMLQYLGPSPENTFQRILKTLREDAKALPNAQEMGKKLSIGAMQGYYDLLSGRADSSVNPMLSNFTNIWKQITLMSKGGGIVFSMLGDRAFIQSGMARLGANALHRLNVQIGKIAANTPEGKRQLQSLGFGSHALSTHLADRWNTDVRPFNAFDRGTSFLFKVQGVDKLTDNARKVAASFASENLGNLSGKSFDELPDLMKIHLEGYQMSKSEWDIIRSTAFDIKHEDMAWKVVAPDRMQQIPDELIDRLLAEEGTTISNPNRARKRDLLESKMSAYFSDVVDDMVPTPGLRQRYIMTGGGSHSGTLTRSALDLFFTFKGFGMTVAMRNARTYSRLWAAGQYKAVGMQAASLIAQTAALGYIGWAAREALKGRTPPLITDENGELDAKQFASVFMESLRRGGGLGIYGDYLLTAYNRDNKTFLEGVAGPVLSELDPMAALGTSTVKVLTGDQEPESFALQSLRFAESNTPFINLFYTKFMLDQFFLWNLKEGLSPGLFRKTQRNIQDQWRQEYYIEPIID